VKDEEDVYGEEARGEDDMDDDDDEGQEAEVEATLRANVSYSLTSKPINCKKGSPYSIAERRVTELIRVLGSQPAGDVSHKPGGRMPLHFRQACSYPCNP